MSVLNQPTYGLENLYLFPVYQTREAYQAATGMETPPYNPNKRIKSWFDPEAATSTKRTIIYERTLVASDSGMPLAGADGKPLLDVLAISREDAAAVNIPPKGPGILDQPVMGTEVPVPLRELSTNEELFFQFGGSVAVRNKTAFAAIEIGFTAEDRAIIREIARKLGIEVS